MFYLDLDYGSATFKRGALEPMIEIID